MIYTEFIVLIKVVITVKSLLYEHAEGVRFCLDKRIDILVDNYTSYI